ncbi:hypothetical protein [Haladaptatus sp. DFWS20]|uniref:hypothetical protein n=1 Tax=Haladaptatus sp. DFWS20 TaxID=3403467 RepID=UPI003EB8E7D3
MSEYAAALNMKWREVVSKTKPGESRYDNMNHDQLRMTIGAMIARVAVFAAWLYIEWRVYRP